ncbi:MAG: 5-deoxy-glucuronate isomerase [Oscillospiraceae bacterium]
MSKFFGYPDFSAEGVQTVTTRDGYYKDALMDVTVYAMKEGDTRSFCFAKDEMALLLMFGKIQLTWQEHVETVERETCFDDGRQAYALHVCAGVKVQVSALAPTEIIVQSTENERSFESRFYTPLNTRNEIFAENLCGGTCVRRVTTFFDYETAPYSNLVLGEVYTRQGSWSGYPPHHHPQPEVYYYRVDKPQGFGACFIGDDVYKITDHSFACISNDAAHPQATAPGYQVYLVWIIRHLPNNPWVDRVEYPEHQWLKDAKF